MKYLFFLSFKCDGLQAADQPGSAAPSGEFFFFFTFSFSLFFEGGAALRLPVLSRHAGS